MSKINYNSQQLATVINQQKLVDGKWKIFCIALALLYVGDTMAGDTFSQNKNSEYNSKYFDFNKPDQYNTSLINAIIDAGTASTKNMRIKKIEYIKSLLKQGAKPDDRNKYGETPLMFAAQYNLVEIVQLLLSEYGAGVNKIQRTGDTALIYAFRANLEEKDTNQLLKTIQLLIQYGADLNQKNKKGQTALMFAAQEGYTKVLKFMLSREITDPVKDLLIRDKTKRKTTNSYIEEKSLETGSKSQIRNIDINTQDNFGSTALMYATNNPEMVNLLIQCGANINIKDHEGKTALDYAYENRNEEVIKIIENQRSHSKEKQGYPETNQNTSSRANNRTKLSYSQTPDSQVKK